MKDISNERNTMLRDGVLYDLVISKEVECCEHCAFNGQSICPGQCNSRSGDGYWVKGKPSDNKKVTKRNGAYEGKTFRDLPCRLIPYKDKCYRSWWVEVNPGEMVKFAEISLHNALDNNGDCDNEIDCSIAYYVALDDDVQSSIEDYND